nr:unnamed protein product [Callosobruchus analis]
MDSIQKRAVRLIDTPILTKDLHSLEHRRRLAGLCPCFTDSIMEDVRVSFRRRYMEWSYHGVFQFIDGVRQ